MEKRSKVGVVVPTCRGYTIPDQSIDCYWVFVHDDHMRDIDGNCDPWNMEHVVKPDPERYGYRNSSIRSAGVLAAYKAGCDFILTVDDDCRLPIDWAERHVKELSKSVHPFNNTMDCGIKARGLPYTVKHIPVWLTHGLWDGVPDVDGATQTVMGAQYVRHADTWRRIYPYFPMSGMNLGFRREAARYMYWAPQGAGWMYDRFEDIWMGLVVESIFHAKNVAMMNGGACVYHSRASNPTINLRKEGYGHELNEWLWGAFNEGILFHPGLDALESIFEHLADGLGIESDELMYIEKWLTNATEFSGRFK